MPKGFLFDIQGRDNLTPVAQKAGASLARMGALGLQAFNVMSSAAGALTLKISLLGFAIAKTVGAVREQVQAGIELGRAINEVGRETDATSDKMAALEFISRRTGLSIDELTAASSTARSEFGLTAEEVDRYVRSYEDAADAASELDQAQERTRLALDSIKAEFAGAFDGIIQLKSRLEANLAEFGADIFENLGDISITSGAGGEGGRPGVAGGGVNDVGPDGTRAPVGYQWVTYRRNARAPFTTELQPWPDDPRIGSLRSGGLTGPRSFGEDFADASAQIQAAGLPASARLVSTLANASERFGVSLETILADDRVVTLASQLNELAAGSEAAATHQERLNRAIAGLDPALDEFYEGGGDFLGADLEAAIAGFDPQGRNIEAQRDRRIREAQTGGTREVDPGSFEGLTGPIYGNEQLIAAALLSQGGTSRDFRLEPDQAFSGLSLEVLERIAATMERLEQQGVDSSSNLKAIREATTGTELNTETLHEIRERLPSIPADGVGNPANARFFP
ncbi:MAG: hypothetical protein F4103_03455 [Boseongicola sp. SB0673_bin_14]|nr:hypothetical protein [Boseongicola sp. SB0673_bin_14]